MTQPISYAINTQSISFETFEEEVVLINLRKGFYYSFEQVGKTIWALLEQRQSTDSIIQKIHQLYQGDPEEMTEAILSFLHHLEEEEMVVRQAEEGRVVSISEEVVHKQPFTAPVLCKHHDLQDLLLLDPIHEVNEAGWPAPKP
jgi:hypothetical protein